MDLNPDALLPSACIPHIPKTDLREMLKIYGEAPLTVSTTTFSVGAVPDKFGEGSNGADPI